MHKVYPSLERHKNINLPEENWTKVITPPRGLGHISWKELWEYRELIGLFAHRDFVSIYKQTVLGSVWHILQPLLQTLVFVLIFSGILNTSTDGVPPILFFLSGIACWRYFSDCAIKISTTFTTNQAIFDKIYFPRLVAPIAEMIVNFLGFLVQILLFILLYLIFWGEGAAIRPNLHLFIVPGLIFELGALALGVGCLMAALTTRYRDLTMSIPFFMQLGMYASCVVFPLSQVSPRIRWIIELNPFVPIIEAFRYAFMGSGAVTLIQILYGTLISVLVAVLGVMVFNKVARVSVDSA